MGIKEDTLYNRVKKHLKVRLSLIIVIVAAIVLEGGGLLQYYYSKREASSPLAGPIFFILLIIGLALIVILMIRATKNMKHLGEVTATKERLEGELVVARNIQMAMIPKIFPPFPERDDLDMYAGLVPAKEVGGDLYDFYIRDEKLFFCIGDVSGKGVPASLVMAVTRALFRTLSSHEDSPARIVSAMNGSMSEGNEYNIFVTLFLGVLDLESGRLRYCNAGHNAPVTLTDRIAELDVLPNLALGVLSGFNYIEQETVLHHDDAIFLYTDGITEAENNDKELFGLERMLSVLHTRRRADDQVASVVRAVDEFAGGAPQNDDRTLLFIHYLGEGNTEFRHLVLHNDIRQIPQLARFVETIADEKKLDQGLALSLNLALEEAVSNVIMYAYPGGADGLVDVDAVLGPGKIVFILTDSGRPFDPTYVPEANVDAPIEDRPIGGLGIHLVRQIMDEMHYERHDGKNILTMTKNI
ncbi:MAG: SpoIIE family protein phosphatase [Bacteroidales bacterium]|nr:SpoIIE family protein phosphatase [Bacteroidales bacterium]